MIFVLNCGNHPCGSVVSEITTPSTDVTKSGNVAGSISGKSINISTSTSNESAIAFQNEPRIPVASNGGAENSTGIGVVVSIRTSPRGIVMEILIVVSIDNSGFMTGTVSNSID